MHAEILDSGWNVHSSYSVGAPDCLDGLSRCAEAGQCLASSAEQAWPSRENGKSAAPGIEVLWSPETFTDI